MRDPSFQFYYGIYIRVYTCIHIYTWSYVVGSDDTVSLYHLVSIMHEKKDMTLQTSRSTDDELMYYSCCSHMFS